MTKGQLGNKEAKKPKKVPSATPPAIPATDSLPAAARGILAPRPGKR
jgi:hypothetical protein